MSINILISGKLHAALEQPTSKVGKNFVSAKLRVSNGDDTTFAGIVAFSDAACAALLAPGAGDAVVISGSATIKAWADREGNARPNLDVVADVVLTIYALQKRRAAVAGESGQRRQPAQRQRSLEAVDDFGAAGSDDWFGGAR